MWTGVPAVLEVDTMAEWNPKANDLFLRAAEIVAPAERGEFLDRECGDDSFLREQVNSLLVASQNVGSFLGQPAVSLHTTPEAMAIQPPICEGPGTGIGPYTLL